MQTLYKYISPFVSITDNILKRKFHSVISYVFYVSKPSDEANFKKIFYNCPANLFLWDQFP